MSPHRGRRAAVALLTALLLIAVVAGCRGNGGAADRALTGAGPRVDAPASMRATVGDTARVDVEVRDGDDSDEITATALPAGATLDDGTLRFSPTTAGTWTATLRAGDGPATTIAFVARYPARPDTLVALGDSVASGQGLELADWLGRDPCWRALDDAYPGLVFDTWRKGRADAEFALVACSGATTGDLLTSPVAGGPKGAAPSGATTLSQVDWAVRANPGLVTITIGANDLEFSSPAKSFTPQGTLRPEVDERLARVESGLGAVLSRLVDETDARIVVTTYHDPAATNPQGVDGCEGACFARTTRDVVDRLALAVEHSAARFTPKRVLVADVRRAFEGHGAPNGVGLDAIRTGGLGPLGDAASRLLGGVSAFCARDGPTSVSWVNALDCVHPNAAGARAYAEVVTTTIDRFPRR